MRASNLSPSALQQSQKRSKDENSDKKGQNPDAKAQIPRVITNGGKMVSRVGFEPTTY